MEDSDWRALGSFQLEFLLQVLKEVAGENAVLGALQPVTSNRTNIVHDGIARLAAQGMCDTVFTVNFDTLIESACFRAGVRCRVHPRPPASLSADCGVGCVNLFKLHGSIDIPETLMATLEDVGRPLSPLWESLLAASMHANETTFLGYRGADDDLLPSLLRILDTTPRRATWNAFSIDGIDTRILSAIPSAQIRIADCRQVMTELLESLGIDASIEGSINSADTGPEIECRLSKHEARVVVRRVLDHLGLTEALKRLIVDDGDEPSEASAKVAALVDHHRLEVRQGHWRKSQAFIRRARAAAGRVSGEEGLWLSLLCDLEEGKFLCHSLDPKGPTNLLQSTKRLLTLPRSRRTDWWALHALTILVEAYPLGFESAEQARHFVELAENRARTHPQLKAVVERTQGILYSRLGQYPEAITTLTRAIEKLTGKADRNGSLIAMRELTRAMREYGNIAGAREVVDEALHLAEEYENPARRAELLEENARTCMTLGEVEEAETSAREAFIAYRRMGAPRRAHRAKLWARSNGLRIERSRPRGAKRSS